MRLGADHALRESEVQTELLAMLLRPESVEDVIGLLDSLDVEILSLSDVQGVGRQHGHTEIFRGREYGIETRPKVRIEVLVSGPEKREEVIRRVRDEVYTGHVGDGKVFVLQVQVPTGNEREPS
jgi:nitrogen regulatory protein PII